MTVKGSLYIQVLMLLTLCLGGAGLAGQEVSGPFGSVASFKPGPVRTLEQQASFKVGNAQIQFSGRWSPLLQGNQQVGLFLEGNGSLTYTSSFEPEWPVLERNSKEMGGVIPTKEGATRSISILFTRARILLAGAPFPSWEGSASGDLPAYPAFVERWQKVDGHFPAHLLAAQAMNAPDRTVAFIEIEGSDRRWLYRHDGLGAMEEVLEAVRPIKSALPDLKDWYAPAPVSRQYLRWNPRKDPPPVHFRVNALDVDLRTVDNRQAEVVVQETPLPLGDRLRAFPFEPGGYVG